MSSVAVPVSRGSLPNSNQAQDFETAREITDRSSRRKTPELYQKAG
jgi:hypothetical protein